MRYTILGTGGIGGYYGGRLQLAGYSVSFLARSEYAHLKQHGLQVQSVDGDFKLDEIAVFQRPEEVPEADVVVICMKTTANSNLAEILRPIVRPGTVLLVLQNGLGMEEELKELFPEAVVVGGMCFICTFRIGPGRISHVDKGLIQGAVLQQDDVEIAEKIAGEFSAAGIPFSLRSDLRTTRWGKLLWNIPFNGLSVVMNANTQELLGCAEGEALVRRLMQEVVAGAKAEGCQLSEEQIEPMIEFTKVMTPYKPSMKLDFEAGRPMELHYMFRKPLAAASVAGVKLPMIAMLADQLAFLENSRMR